MFGTDEVAGGFAILPESSLFALTAHWRVLQRLPLLVQRRLVFCLLFLYFLKSK